MEVKIRKAHESDFEAYYNHKCESSDIYWNGFEGKPNEEDLKKAFLSRIDGNGPKVINVIETDERYAGYVQYTYNNNEVEIGIGIIEEYAGKGYGSEAVALAAGSIDQTYKIFARIRDDNLASRKCFEKAGYIETSEYSLEKYYPEKQEIKLRRYDWVG